MFPSFNFLGKIPPPASYLGLLNCELMTPTVPRIAACVRQAYKAAHNDGRQELGQGTTEGLGPGICPTNRQRNPEVVGGEGRAPLSHSRMRGLFSDLQVVRVLAWLFLKNKISKEADIGGSWVPWSLRGSVWDSVGISNSPGNLNSFFPLSA